MLTFPTSVFHRVNNESRKTRGKNRRWRPTSKKKERLGYNFLTSSNSRFSLHFQYPSKVAKNPNYLTYYAVFSRFINCK